MKNKSYLNKNPKKKTRTPKIKWLIINNLIIFYLTRNYTISITDSTTSLTSQLTVVNETSQLFDALEPSVVYNIRIAANDDFGEIPDATQIDEITRKLLLNLLLLIVLVKSAFFK